ncbi:MAG: hypothetical protein H8E57_02700, partial [Candidatus Cloacimonetes bacterium]|nr:hypothetical protein [Candidatus Cloacimonadota bacterium]
MIEKYNSVEFLQRIQKLKLKAVSIPIVIILFSFGLNFVLQISFLKYLSLFGLAAYIFVSLLFRINKNVSPDTDPNAYYSPLNGKIVTAKNNVVIIEKTLFQASEIRHPSNNENAKFEIIAGKSYIFESTPTLIGKLIGIVPGSATCKCYIPENFLVEIRSGQSVIAGETIL